MKRGKGWIGASTTGWPKESRRLSISMRGSAARSIVGGIVGEECPRCRGSVPAEAAFAVRRHESKSNVITFESEHPPCISSLRRFFGLPVVPRALLQILNVYIFDRTTSIRVRVLSKLQSHEFL